MSSFTDIKSELNNQIGFTESNRFGTTERESAINQSLPIIYGLLTGSNIIKRSGTISVSSSVATPPSDFNDGTVLYMGDASTFENSNPIWELPRDKYGRVDSTDDDYFVVNEDGNGDTQFQFNTVSSGTLYIEYEKGAPILSNGTDDDGLPKKAKYITAQLAAGILTQNLLNDEDKLQIFLYGPKGNSSNVSPTSVMGQLNLMKNKRRVGKSRRARSRATIHNRRGRRLGVDKYLFR